MSYDDLLPTLRSTLVASPGRRRRLVLELGLDSGDLLLSIEDEGPAAGCTGLTASWCQRCGVCRCPGDDGPGDDLDCPLHAPGTPHARDERVVVRHRLPPSSPDELGAGVLAILARRLAGAVTRRIRAQEDARG